MNEATLRAKAADRGRKVSDAAWDDLVARLYVEDARIQDSGEEQVAVIVEAIDQLKTMWGSGKDPEAGNEEPPEDEERVGTTTYQGKFAPEITDAERERASLMTEAQVRVASTDPRVESFRRRYLSDGPLLAERAEAFLEAQDTPELDALAGHLQTFHGWHKGEATWWVLTGEPPGSRPVKVSYRSATSWYSPDLYLITIEAPPWISPETFQGAFAEMRRRMQTERKPPEARTIRVVRFVEALRHDPASKRLTFAEMWRRWNQTHHDEAFPKPRTFETAYRRTARILDRKYNTAIEREETPELRRQQARHRRWLAAARKRSANLPPPKGVEDSPVRLLE